MQRPDPLLVAKRFNDEKSALVCALFGYGNARKIVEFLSSLPLHLLHAPGTDCEPLLRHSYYRFQKSRDIIALFRALERIESVEDLFWEAYGRNGSVLEGIQHVINAIHDRARIQSRGFTFLVGKAADKPGKSSTFKRWNMYLRWMVRKDCLDMGLWSGVSRKDLLIPLDTHTFNVSRRLGLLRRKSYDQKAVVELTKRLREFDPDDPVKYDFALYRMGQEAIV